MKVTRSWIYEYKFEGILHIGRKKVKEVKYSRLMKIFNGEGRSGKEGEEEKQKQCKRVHNHNWNAMPNALEETNGDHNEEKVLELEASVTKLGSEGKGKHRDWYTLRIKMMEMEENSEETTWVLVFHPCLSTPPLFWSFNADTFFVFLICENIIKI